VVPEVAAQWHATKNGDMTPADMVAKSRKKDWFKRDAGPDHKWESTLAHRVSDGRGCPCCVNQKVQLARLAQAGGGGDVGPQGQHPAHAAVVRGGGQHQGARLLRGRGGRPFEHALGQFKNQ
jgi:hypothetical protein